MAGKRISVVLTALVFVIGGVAVGTAGSSGSITPRAVADTARAEAGPSCKKCRKIVRKAKRCKAQDNDSAKCKRAIKKSKKCKKVLKSERCRRPSGGGGGGGGSPSPSPSSSPSTGGGSCPEYTPGEQGAGKPIALVTDAATAEKPIEIAVDVGEGVPESPNNAPVYHNVQVDSAGTEAGLFVRFEFDEPEDMDLFLNYSSGEEAAHAGGYNPAPVIPGETDGTGDGGHSEVGAEQLDGIRTADCGGYTVDMRPFQNAPGTKTLKLWLGAPENEPK